MRYRLWLYIYKVDQQGRVDSSVLWEIKEISGVRQTQGYDRNEDEDDHANHPMYDQTTKEGSSQTSCGSGHGPSPTNDPSGDQWMGSVTATLDSHIGNQQTDLSDSWVGRPHQLPANRLGRPMGLGAGLDGWKRWNSLIKAGSQQMLSASSHVLDSTAVERFLCGTLDV
ncbi:hypothetical protein NFI96_015443 [Prochilodus magdalenae]|nr:hypothetical protein NFI96_015443 [Prochilodus magdalenae]